MENVELFLGSGEHVRVAGVQPLHVELTNGLQSQPPGALQRHQPRCKLCECRHLGITPMNDGAEVLGVDRDFQMMHAHAVGKKSSVLRRRVSQTHIERGNEQRRTSFVEQFLTREFPHHQPHLAR